MIKPDMQSPKRRYRMSPWRIAGAALVIAALVVLYWASTRFQPASPSDHTAHYVSVAPGATADDVASSLQHQHIIKSAWAFSMMSRMDHLSSHLTSGVYRLSPSETLSQILQKMKSGQVAVDKVTIPEGFTVSQILQRLAQHHIGTMRELKRLAERPLPGMPTPHTGVRDPLEGYLFPATYDFSYGISARGALTTMWKTFQRKALQGVYDKSQTKLSVAQWVTMASIIQQEDRDPHDASKVAAVFSNRIAARMPLQSDATVRYAIGHPISGGLSLGDLQVASPFNTYRHKGLPPGPITNPGLLMLKAALSPAHVPYLYFISLRNGHDMFATTYQQHLRNIQKVNHRP